MTFCRNCNKDNQKEKLNEKIIEENVAIKKENISPSINAKSKEKAF